jgi:hypothetical protein
MNFVKKIFTNQTDEPVHRQFIRFGKGDYKGRFLLGLRKSKNIKLKSSFEFANDFVFLCSAFGNCKVSGEVLSKQDISDFMSMNNIQGDSETKKGGLFYKNNISSQEISGELLNKLAEESYFALLDIEGEDFILKIKKKLPKPGKNEGKIDDKFCQLEVDNKYHQMIKDDFFWDMPDAKKINVKHEVVIDRIVMPEGEKDFAKIRELAKRAGKLIRIGDADGKEVRNEVGFEA